MVFPGSSLAAFQIFICKKIYKDTYLLVSEYKLECPWGGEDLEMWRLDTWNSLAFFSLSMVIVYPIGIPLVMLMLMRHNGVPRLAKQKIGTSLVNEMIIVSKPPLHLRPKSWPPFWDALLASRSITTKKTRIVMMMMKYTRSSIGA